MMLLRIGSNDRLSRTQQQSEEYKPCCYQPERGHHVSFIGAAQLKVVMQRRHGTEQRITHPDPTVFEAWGFVSEASPVRQLTLIPDLQN